MPRLIGALALLCVGTAAGLAHAADSYPTELTLAHPDQRQMSNPAGKSMEAMQAACPQSMLNIAPATQARNISERVLRYGNNQDQTIIETDAELVNVPVGTEQKTIPVTFRCEFRDGLLTLGVWTRGLVGVWTVFDGLALRPDALGTPLPD